MTHPCASKNPPAWCNKKRRRKGGKRKVNRKALSAMLSVANNPTEHGFKRVSEKVCLKANGRLKKGCMRGRGKHRGMIFKRAR